MNARLTTLATTAVLAVSVAAPTAGATIPWDTRSGSSPGVRTLQSAGAQPATKKPTRTLAVVRQGYDWRDYVSSHVVGADYRFVADRRGDAFDRRDGPAAKVSLLDRGYHPGAYVPGGAPLNVAKAIQAAGKKSSGPDRTVQSGKKQLSGFRYAR
jgi:hypothetical protein